MGYDELARRLADRDRSGLSPELADQLKLPSEDVLRGQLMALSDERRGPMSVSLLSVYVVDDTDTWDKGEIYWWTIPVLVDTRGNARWSPLSGLPMGAAPHKCGSQEWMTNFSLAESPLVALIPPDEEIAACVVRLAIYDDDDKPADVPRALGEGYAAISRCAREGLAGAHQVIVPVREAIFNAVGAKDDDILLDEDVTIRRGGATCFNVGFVGAIVSARARAYYVVKDELRTETMGPAALRRGQSERLPFKTKPARGGRLSVFARGADVKSDLFGSLTTEMPFGAKVLDEHLAEQLERGLLVSASGAAKVVAFYTPPSER